MPGFCLTSAAGTLDMEISAHIQVSQVGMDYKAVTVILGYPLLRYATRFTKYTMEIVTTTLGYPLSRYVASFTQAWYIYTINCVFLDNIQHYE